MLSSGWRHAKPLLVGAVLVLSGSNAAADDTHYQDFIVGGRAMGLGGAYTSIADDPSGIYYNPAGIADVQRSNLQLDTSLYGFERGAINAATLPVPGVTDLRINFTDLIVIPGSAGFVTSFGSRGADGKTRQAYGVSIIVPSFRSFVLTPGAQAVQGIQGSYQSRVTDRELWSGVGYGRKVGKALRLGVSAYYVLRSLDDQENVALAQVVTGSQQQRFETVSHEINAVIGNLALILGAKYCPAPQWSFGASLRLPSLQVNDAATLTFLQSFADPQTGQGMFQTTSLNSPANMNYAPVLRLGASYESSQKYTFSADVSVHAPTHYTLVEAPADLSSRLPFSPQVQRHWVVNGNVGAEVVIIREVSVAAGIFTDISSAPDIATLPSGDALPHVNLFGLSMALGYIGEYTLSRLGMVYSFGEGHDAIPSAVDAFQGPGASLLQFARVNYFQSFFYVFVSSSFRYG